MAKTLKTFHVMAKLILDCGVDVKAESLEEALDKARLMKEKDFVEVLGEYTSGDMNIFGIYEND